MHNKSKSLLILFSFIFCSIACVKSSNDDSIKPLLLRVMTYNIGIFSGVGFINGSEEGAQILHDAIEEQDADIIGLQEDDEMFGAMNPRDVIYSTYPYYYRMGNSVNNYKAFASIYSISNVRQFYCRDDSYHHPYFLVGELEINGKELLIVSFHLDWADKNRRLLQIQQMIEFADNYENVILMGDTNCQNYINSNIIDDTLLYEQEWALFTKQNYSCANNGDFGLFPTTPYDQPLDNFFVKGTIIIKNAFSVVKAYMDDHYMVCADLLI